MIASPFVRQLLVGLVAAAIAGCSASSTGSPTPGTPGSAGPTSGAPGTALSSLAPLPTLAPPPIDLTGVPSRLHVDAAKGNSSWIGPAGGTVTASAADGTTYELDVPPLAVGDRTPITMTPVASIDTLGLSGGLAGAVYLGPTGLKLTEPATLKITTTKPAPAGMRLVGFDVAHDGVRTDLVPATATGGVLTVLVTHFSSPGVGFGTTDDLERLNDATALSPASGDMASRLSELLALPTPWVDATQPDASQGSAQITESILVIGGAHRAVMDPELQTSSSDADLVRVVSDWQTFILMLNLAAHDGDYAAAVADGTDAYIGGLYTPYFIEGQTKLGGLILRAIEGNKALCTSTHDLHALANIAYWAGIGLQYDPPWGGWATAQSGCAQIVMDLFNPATNLNAGGSDSFQVGFAIKFVDGTNVHGDFTVAMHAIGFSFANGSSNATAGEVSSEVLTVAATASAGPPYQVIVSACWSLDGLVRDLCSGQEARSFAAAGPVAGTGQGAGQPTGQPGPSTIVNGLYIGAWTTCNTTVNKCITKPGSIRPPIHSIVPDWVLTTECLQPVAFGTYQFRFADTASFTAIGVSPDNRCQEKAPTMNGSLTGTTLTFTLTNGSQDVWKFSGVLGPWPT